MSRRWLVFRVPRGSEGTLTLAGSSDARNRDIAIRDVAAGAGEYVAIPGHYLERVAIVHEESHYSITARVGGRFA